MALVTAAAAATAAGLYLDAKYGIKKDLRDLRVQRNAIKLYTEAVRSNRQSLYNFFEKAVAAHPSAEAIWSRAGCYTWQETSDRVNQYARFFLAQGVKPHDYVGFYLMNSPEFIFAWLALWAISAAPAMINYQLSGNALLHCLNLSGSRILLVDEDSELRARIDESREAIEGRGMKILVMDGEIKSYIAGMSEQRVDDSFRDCVRGDWPMAMFYTSGTTGLPKGVPFNVDRGFMGGVSRAAGSTITQPDDRWYDCMPYYHGTGGVIAMNMMMVGNTLCIGRKFSTSRFWGEVHDSKATWITYVGETARYLLAAPPSPLDKDHNLRGMYGNGLRPDVWIKFRERFNVEQVAEFFASSEGIFSLINRCRGDYLAGAVGYHGAISRYLNRNVMVPVRIDEATGAIERDPNTGFAYRERYEVGGEMIVQIADVKQFAGYYGNPSATKKKFERDVFRKGDLWYRSGDALRRTKDGKWFFMDRLGDTYRWKGENVSTAEVAAILGRFPGVVEANVYGVTLPTHDGRAGCAAVYIDPSSKKGFDFAGLLEHSRSHLPKYAVPVFLRIVSEMSPMHNNKQNKVPLRAEGVDPEKVKAGDKILWIDDIGKGATYVDFRTHHWEDLKFGRARL